MNSCDGTNGHDWKWLESVDTDFNSFGTPVVGMESDSHTAYHLLGDDNENFLFFIVIILMLECCDKEIKCLYLATYADIYVVVEVVVFFKKILL